jgi:diguanylate cyclase (GGDEF)-like protein
MIGVEEQAVSQQTETPVDAKPEADVRRIPRLLIVDDVLENREILLRRFQRKGFHAIGAEGGSAALALLERETFDAVLLDVMMPDMDGIEILHRIRTFHSQSALPVIMVTAKSQSEDIVVALAAGANDYLTKPVDFAVALARVNVQIDRKFAEDQAVEARQALQYANRDLERRVAERTANLQEVNQRLQGEISQRERTEAKIQYLAYHDALTGLANRLLFREQLEQALVDCQASGQGLALLFLDLDGFKVINDTLGHSVGDAFLRSVANTLRDGLPEARAIGRLGGDEFAIIHLAADPADGAAALAATVVRLITRPHEVDGHELVTGVSIGIAVAPLDGSVPEQLLQRADLAMYRAKQDGRGSFRFFEPAMDAEEQARRQIELDLRSAVTHGQFAVHYQPFMNVATGEVTGVEALVRWNHPTRGLLMPARFISLAEETGLIVPLGEWVLRKACSDAAHWPANVKIAVNLSPVQFASGSLVTTVVQALAASGLRPDRLELEITESVLLARTDANLAILNQLRQLGVCIVMDDFGTGYSSLSCLHQFRFDKVKIDQMFVRNLPRTDDSRAIVRAVTGIGSSLGMSTTAEGVETEAQLNFLREHGCDEVQGFFFSEPQPAAEIDSIFARRRKGVQAA